MLEIRNVSKRYVTGQLTQQALDDVSLSFRDNEFVSILGPSGSGKTTLLNIIGGLDRYDAGDLIINGTSTKQYKDADWDAYRNHTIGFVFQSYNLIPHQSVLSNVELALTISGVSRAERRKRALEALNKVGLGGQEHKRPNQMSGGQMQRVAIARALVNNPDILLADEPTGALDTATGLQIMELLRQVAEDRLVIMVTHNPELAERYSTRIVTLHDGHIVGDTMPLSPQAAEREARALAGSGAVASGGVSSAAAGDAVAVGGTSKSPGSGRRRTQTGASRRVKMSWLTSLSLSFDNLRTKKGRTLLTSFAGSIGIIGIAAILALSSGVNNYIDRIQYDTMSSYPITISSTTVDLNAMLAAGGMGGLGGSGGSGASASRDSSAHDMTKAHADYSDIKQSEAVASSIKSNNLTDFKKYLDNPDSDIHQYLGENGIVYSYDVNFSVLAADPDGDLIDTDADVDALADGGSSSGDSSANSSSMSGTSGAASENGMPGMMGGGMAGSSGATAGGAGTGSGASGGVDSMMSAMTGSSNNSSAGNFSQLMPGQHGEPVSAVTRDSYDLLDGSWPSKATDVVLVLDDNNAIPAGTLYQLGLISADQYREAADAIADDKEAPALDWSYDELVGRTFTLVTASDRYVDNGDGTFSYRETSDGNMSALKDSGLELKVSGVIRPAENAQNATISTAVAYTQQLTDWMIGHTDSSAVVQAQEASADTDVLTGVAFADETGENGSGAKRTYDDNLEAFGKVSRDAPSSISIYTDSFDDKEAVADCIKAYNKGKDEDHRTTYTDYVALMTSSITSIVNIITYVLIAFVAVSLVVSCIMIGIITHISVMERTKEIGILRALGASKRNISQVFNAETIIIGLCSGLLGVGLTALLTIPANAMVAGLLGSDNTLTISLPIGYAAILVALSVLITLIGGLLPARKAAHKDPVIALRTE